MTTTHPRLPRDVTWLTLVFGLAATLAATMFVAGNAREDAKNAFDFYCDEARLKALSRLEEHKQVLLGGAALFDASTAVEREEWRNYAQRLQLDQHFKGIQGFGFALAIPKQNLGAHIVKVRAQGFPNYSVWPGGSRDLYSAIIYLEPFKDRNLRAFGYDMYSEPVRQAAMARSRDQNIAALSGKVHLVQETSEDVQAGTLMYVPVYRLYAPIATIEERRSALLGWIYSPFRMKDLLDGLLSDRGNIVGNLIRLRVYDGTAASQASLLYDSMPDASPMKTLNVVERQMDFNGSIWNMRFELGDGNAQAIDYSKAYMTFGAGLLASLLLFLLFRSLQNTQLNAHRIAEQLTLALQKKVEAERSLNEKLQLQSAALEASANAIMITDAEGVISWINGAFTNMTGYTAQEAIGARPETLSRSGEHADDFYNRLWETIKSGSIWQGELVNRRKDGTLYHEEMTITPVTDKQGDIQQYVAVKQDISQRKQAEALLKESEENLRQILANSPEGVLAISVSNHISFCNEQLIDMLALQRMPDKQLHISEFIEQIGNTISQKDAQELDHALRTELREGAFRTISPKRIIKWESRELVSSELHTILFFRDVTKDAEIDEMKSEFLATAAHELRTPMSSIYGFVELMLTRATAEEERREYLQIVYDQTKSLIMMLNELLDLSRIEARAGKDFKFTPSDIATVIQKTLLELNLPTQTHPVLFVREAGEWPLLMIDEEKIKQVFTNVIGNAYKYSPSGGQISITHSIEDEGGLPWLSIKVSDHGIGMTKEQSVRAFDRFYRANAYSNIPGTGLGLSLVKEIVQIHGGSVGMESRAGAGTDCILRFPINPNLNKGDVKDER